MREIALGAAGDEFWGSEWDVLHEGAQTGAALQAAGTDVMVVGNHEFDYGSHPSATNCAAPPPPHVSSLFLQHVARLRRAHPPSQFCTCVTALHMYVRLYTVSKR